MWPSPPRLCLVLFLYSVFCHLGAASYRSPRPGGTLGRTWRLLGPNEGEATNKCESFKACPQTEGGHFVPLCGAKVRDVEAEPKATISSQRWFKLQQNKQHWGGSVTRGISIHHFKPSAGDVVCYIFVGGSSCGFLIFLKLRDIHSMNESCYYLLDLLYFLARKCSFSN